MAKQWTKELDDALTTMHGAGMTAKEIGSIMDRTAGAVGQRAFHLGITKKRSDSLPIDLPTYIDDETEVPVDFMWRGEPTEWNAPKTKQKPLWWTAMMWWRK